jgi:hypothetical protein
MVILSTCLFNKYHFSLALFVRVTLAFLYLKDFFYLNGTKKVSQRIGQFIKMLLKKISSLNHIYQETRFVVTENLVTTLHKKNKN